MIRGRKVRLEVAAIAPQPAPCHLLAFSLQQQVKGRSFPGKSCSFDDMFSFLSQI